MSHQPQQDMLQVCGSMMINYSNQIAELNEMKTYLETRLKGVKNADAGIQGSPCDMCQVLTMLRIGARFFCSNDCVERFKNAQLEEEDSQPSGSADAKP